MDPSTYKTIREASKKIGKALNRLMSYLRKRLGFRPSYICVLEPQETGNPHLHIVLFGISRLADYKELNNLFPRLGFGKIHYEYTLVKNKRNQTFNWSRKKPGNSSTDPKSYLEKYLRKSLYSSIKNGKTKIEVCSWHFATNKQFFTYSRILRASTKRIKITQYELVGSYLLALFRLDPSYLAFLSPKSYPIVEEFPDKPPPSFSSPIQ